MDLQRLREKIRYYWYLMRAMHDDEFGRFHYLNYLMYLDKDLGKVIRVFDRGDAVDAAFDSPWFIGSSRSRYAVDRFAEDVLATLRWEARCNDKECGVFPSFIPTWKSTIPIMYSSGVHKLGVRSPLADDLTLPDSVLIGSSSSYDEAWELFKYEPLRSELV